MHRLSLAVFKDENKPEGNILPTTDCMTDVLDCIPSMSSRGPWLVGGTVRRVMNNIVPTTDFDIMFKDEAQFEDFCGAMRERGAVTKHESPQQITFEYFDTEIQAIRAAFYPTLIQTLNNFDFTLCQFGFDGTDFVWGDTAAEDVQANKLVFTHTTDPVATMRRMFKYAKQGFYMDSTEIGRFLKAMTKQEADIDKSKEKWTSGQITAAPSYASGGLVEPPFPHPPIKFGKPQLGDLPARLSSGEVFVSRANYERLRKMGLDASDRILERNPLGSTGLKVIVSDSI